MQHQTNNFEETQGLGKAFAKQVQPGDVLLLFGNLGAGKTTFLQGFAKGLGIEKRIISPTFIIIRRYALSEKTFYHIDLYRTQTEDNLKGLALPEILQEKDAIVAIEWPEKLGKFMPKNLPAGRQVWSLEFETIDENKRSITIEKHE